MESKSYLSMSESELEREISKRASFLIEYKKIPSPLEILTNKEELNKLRKYADIINSRIHEHKPDELSIDVLTGERSKLTKDFLDGIKIIEEQGVDRLSQAEGLLRMMNLLYTDEEVTSLVTKVSERFEKLKYRINTLPAEIELARAVIKATTNVYIDVYVSKNKWTDILGGDYSVVFIEDDVLIWRDLYSGNELKIYPEENGIEHSFLTPVPIQDHLMAFADIVDAKGIPMKDERVGVPKIETQDEDLVRKLQSLTREDYKRILSSKEFREFSEIYPTFSPKEPKEGVISIARELYLEGYAKISEEEIKKYHKKYHNRYKMLKKKLRRMIFEGK